MGWVNENENLIAGYCLQGLGLQQMFETFFKIGPPIRAKIQNVEFWVASVWQGYRLGGLIFWTGKMFIVFLRVPRGALKGPLFSKSHLGEKLWRCEDVRGLVIEEEILPNCPSHISMYYGYMVVHHECTKIFVWLHGPIGAPIPPHPQWGKKCQTHVFQTFTFSFVRVLQILAIIL